MIKTIVEQSKKSPLKWAGGKKRLIEQISQKLPRKNKKRLIEPFVGGGSVFLNMDFEEYLLVDTNPDLINLFNIIKQSPVSLINEAQLLFNSSHNNAERYYEIRTRFNLSRDPIERSVLFLYLNRHGYNGLCRYNSKGGFNVPFGRYKRPYFPEKEIIDFHSVAQRATFLCADFTHAFSLAKKHDVIYCDPPYSPVNTTASFTNYSGKGFTNASQEQIVECALDAKQKGVSTLISNHYLDYTKHIYKEADEMTKLKVQRNISCKGGVRNKVDEVLALYRSDE